MLFERVIVLTEKKQHTVKQQCVHLTASGCSQIHLHLELASWAHGWALPQGHCESRNVPILKLVTFKQVSSFSFCAQTCEK